MTTLTYRGHQYEQTSTNKWESASILYFQKKLERQQRREKEAARDKQHCTDEIN
jgi:hypothetical protein